jgi:hypothetical protein
MGTLLIDGLKLEAPETWLFRSMGQMILGRRDSGVGSFQISLAFRHDLSGKTSAENCLALAQQFVSRPGMSEPFDTMQTSDGSSRFGGFSFTAGDEFGRVWYRLARGQLVLGVYCCSRQKQQPSELSECEAFMKSAEYV